MFVESSRSIHGECNQQRLCESDSTDVQTVLSIHGCSHSLIFLSYYIKKALAFYPKMCKELLHRKTPHIAFSKKILLQLIL